MLLQHIAALNAKLTVTFEKKIEPLGNQIIAYREVVAPLSQDLKRNLAILTPLLQQIQTLETAVASARDTFGQNSESISQELTSARSEISTALQSIEAAAQSLGASVQSPFDEFRQHIDARLIETISGVESAVEKILSAQEGDGTVAAIETVSGKIEELGTRLSVLDSKADATGQALSETVGKDLTESFRTDLSDLRSQLQELQANFEGKLSSQVNEAAVRLESHQADSASQVVQYLTALSERIDALGSRITELESGTETGQADQISGVLERLEALSDKLDRLESGFGSASEAAQAVTREAVEGINALSKEGLGSQITALNSELQAFQSHASESFEKALQVIKDSQPEGGELLRATLSSEISRLELALEQKTHQFTKDVEAVKYDLQSDISASFKSWNSALGELHVRIESLSSQIDQLSERPATAVQDPAETVYQPVADSNLPDIIRDRVDEVHTRLTNSDWAIQAIGKNMTTLMHEVASMRDDVLSGSMARRTYNAVEDIRVLIEDLPKRNVTGPQSEDLAARLEETIDSVRSAISARPDDVINTLESAKGEILATLAQTSNGFNGPLEESRKEIVTAINALQSISNEIGSQIGQSIASHATEIKRHVEEHLTPTVAAPTVKPDQSAALAAIEAAALQKMAWCEPYKGERPPLIQGYDSSQMMDALKAHDPITFKVWKPIFEAGAQPYIDDPDHNCSTWATELTPRFRDYVSLFVKDAILDIGCGPHPMPAYLEGYPPERLTGLEPLEIAGDAEFPIIKGVNEFLPWADGSFGTVVNSTAIDHVMDLEKSLAETCRVLQPDGHFIIWFADVAGMADYSRIPPKERAAVDSYHLFHACGDWFLPLAKRWFNLVDLRRFQATPTIDNVFATFRPKAAQASRPKSGDRSQRARKTSVKSKASTTKPRPRKRKAKSA